MESISVFLTRRKAQNLYSEETAGGLKMCSVSVHFVGQTRDVTVALMTVESPSCTADRENADFAPAVCFERKIISSQYIFVENSLAI
jgi:hypothetical protein